MIIRAVFLAFAAAILATSAAAQQQPDGATVEVTVHDSLSGGPLPMAVVQLVSAADPMAFSKTGETDFQGRVVFAGIPAGRYSIGFMHPVLDAMGVTAPGREVQVAAGARERVQLAVPSASRLRVAVCGPQAATDSSAVILGTVRDPRDQMPIGEASVAARWMEITFGPGGIRQQVAGTTAVTGGNGWFALCGLPSGTVTIAARQRNDSTPLLELLLKSGEFHRRDLFVATPGAGLLRGRVVSADSARPLAGVRVSVVDGPEATTDAKGEWALGNVALGTRMIEVRGIGFYPERRLVDVLSDGPAVDVSLQTFQAVLDAVRVTATRLTGEAALSGFAERRRGSGMGRFYDTQQIARRNPIYTSDLLRTLPGFVGDGSLTMKSNFSDGAGNFNVGCTAEVYVDGQLLRGISASELDGVVSPENIIAIETYSAGSPKPAQFESGMSGCGALVIWQKPMSERVRRRR